MESTRSRGGKRVWGKESSAGKGPERGTQSPAGAGVGKEEREADRLEGKEGPGHAGPGGGCLIVPGLHPRGNRKPLKSLTSWEHGPIRCNW